MVNEQPEALRLAEELCEPLPGFPEPTSLERAAGNELRRLHESNTELLAALKDTLSILAANGKYFGSLAQIKARAAIAKAERTTK